MRRSAFPIAALLAVALSAGVAEAQAPSPPYVEAWRATSDGPMSGATIAGGVAFVTTGDAVLGFDLADGTRIASYPRTGRLFRPGVGAVDGRAILVFVDGGTASSGASPSPAASATTELVAVDIADGSEPWRTAIGGGVKGGIAVQGEAAYVVDGEGSLLAISLRDGSIRWSATRVGTGDAPPTVVGDVVYASGAPNGSARIVALDVATGERRWAQPPQYGAAATSAIAVEGDALAFIGSDRIARVLDVSTGDARWEDLLLNVPSPVVAPDLTADALYATDYAGGVYRFDPATGERIWDHQLNVLAVRSGPVAVDAGVVLGTDDGRLVALDGATGHLVADVRLGDGVVGAIAVAGDLLIAPVAGDAPELVALRTDPEGTLLDVASPTALDPLALVGRFGLAAAFLLAAAVLGRIVSRRRSGGATS